MFARKHVLDSYSQDLWFGRMGKDFNNILWCSFCVFRFTICWLLEQWFEIRTSLEIKLLCQKTSHRIPFQLWCTNNPAWVWSSHLLCTKCLPACMRAQLRLTLFDPMDCSPPGFSVHGDSPGKNSGEGCHALLQGIFSTEESNPCLLCLLYCWWILNPLSHQGSLSALLFEVCISVVLF